LGNSSDHLPPFYLLDRDFDGNLDTSVFLWHNMTGNGNTSKKKACQTQREPKYTTAFTPLRPTIKTKRTLLRKKTKEVRRHKQIKISAD